MRALGRRGKVVTVLVVVLTFSLALVASAGARPSVGTADKPVMLSVAEEEGYVEAAEVMAEALEIATGLYFDVVEVEYGEAGVDWLCDGFPDRGLRIMPAVEYVIAEEDCGVETSWRLRQFGQDGARGEFLVPRGSGLSSLADLAGLEWYYPDEGSLVGYWAPLYMLNEAGVEYGTAIWTGSHDAAVQVVYDNAVASGDPDPVFATVFLDARTSAGHPSDVLTVVDVLEETPFMPFPVAAFGPEFPHKLRTQIEDLMVGFSHDTHPAHQRVWEDSFGVWPGYASDGWLKAKGPDFHFLKDVMANTDFML